MGGFLGEFPVASTMSLLCFVSHAGAIARIPIALATQVASLCCRRLQTCATEDGELGALSKECVGQRCSLTIRLSVV